MLQITQLKMPVQHTERELVIKIRKTLRLKGEEPFSWKILRRAVDARDKNALKFVYTIEVRIRKEKQVLFSCRHKNVSRTEGAKYVFPEPGDRKADHPPVIVGSGPAGLFCAYELALHGYKPILLERGCEASRRKEMVQEFWDGGPLDPESNVQFGEGGAGTFSDGKLNTGVRDRANRNREVLNIFVRMGAPEEILFDARPHIGTDILVGIVEKMRKEIIRLGGKVYFRTKVTGFLKKEDRITGVRTADGREFPAEAVVLAIGHSARDTFRMLAEEPLLLTAKAFAVGVRVIHPQKMIDDALYGMDAPSVLGAASYHLACNLPDGRGVYSFCMCPGGYVVNASSEAGRLAVNGMSNYRRDSGCANSAVIVSVNPQDFLPYRQSGIPEVLNGMLFQQKLEEAAFLSGKGKIPVQTLADFRDRQTGMQAEFTPMFCGQYVYTDLNPVFSSVWREDFLAGMDNFDKKIQGFGREDAILAGVESRTSSPIRIERDSHLESSLRGLFPCGEGAGYAGGITSAAMDGLRVAEEIARRYACP